MLYVIRDKRLEKMVSVSHSVNGLIKELQKYNLGSYNVFSVDAKYKETLVFKLVDGEIYVV